MANLNEGRFVKNPKVILPNGQMGTVSGGPGPVASVVKISHSNEGHHMEWHLNEHLTRDE